MVKNFLTNVSATTISYVNDRFLCKNQDYNVFVLFFTHNACMCSLKLNKMLLSNKFVSFTLLIRDLIAFRISNVANDEISKVTKLYNRLQVFSTEFYWQEETVVFELPKHEFWKELQVYQCNIIDTFWPRCFQEL
jgi:hypothetical protein